MNVLIRNGESIIAIQELNVFNYFAKEEDLTIFHHQF